MRDGGGDRQAAHERDTDSVPLALGDDGLHHEGGQDTESRNTNTDSHPHAGHVGASCITAALGG
jgi:hypothetical protein